MIVASPYIRVAGRLRVNVAVLAGAGTMGNYNMHTVVRVLADGKVYEAPALTGNAFKHWHAVHSAEQYQALGGTLLNEFCRKGIGLRGKNKEGKDAENECDAIEDFCNDIHGFLLPRQQIKRDSLARFAFAVPVLTRAELENAQKFAVTHNRVDPFQKGKETEMMVFKQEYSTARYGFSAVLDLGLSLRPLYADCRVDERVVPDIEKERKLRIKAVILGLLALVQGGVGSHTARALPIAKLEEVVVAVSDVPIPALVHGAYPDYVEKSLDVLSAFAMALGRSVRVVCYNAECGQKPSLSVQSVRSFSELVDSVLKIADEVASGQK
jgi:CRISPR-associated protein Cst2